MYLRQCYGQLTSLQAFSCTRSGIAVQYLLAVPARAHIHHSACRADISSSRGDTPLQRTPADSTVGLSSSGRCRGVLRVASRLSTRASDLDRDMFFQPDIVSAGAPVLRQVAEDVPEEMFSGSDLKELVELMTGAMRTAPGVGLAAPQINVPLKVMVLEDRQEYSALVPKEQLAAQQREPFDLIAIVNPQLRALGDEGACFFEGCLSVPGWKALVKRYLQVEVTGFTAAGEPLTLRASGWKARILQHEYDHLQGTLYVDRMLTRSFCTADTAAEALPGGLRHLGRCICSQPICLHV